MERINLQYAKRPKKVDFKRLKRNMWGLLTGEIDNKVLYRPGLVHTLGMKSITPKLLIIFVSQTKLPNFFTLVLPVQKCVWCNGLYPYLEMIWKCCIVIYCFPPNFIGLPFQQSLFEISLIPHQWSATWNVSMLKEKGIWWISFSIFQLLAA